MTDPFAPIAAALTVAQQAVAAQQAQAIAAAVAPLDATIAAQAAQIAQLEAELHPTPQPQPAGTAWGVNIPHGSLPKMDKAFGVQAVRWYWPLPAQGQRAVVRFPTAADLGGDLGNRIVVHSAKASPQDIAAGKYDADYQQVCADAPKDRITRLCVRHEPENDTGYSPTDLRAAFARVARIARAAGPHVHVTPILMQYTLDPASHRNLADWLPNPGDYDEIGFDFYPTSLPAIGVMIGRMKAAAAGVGKPWFVGEVGTLGHPEILTALARALAAEKPAAVCYFDGGNNQISNNPAALAAWKAGQTS